MVVPGPERWALSLSSDASTAYYAAAGDKLFVADIDAEGNFLNEQELDEIVGYLFVTAPSADASGAHLYFTYQSSTWTIASATRPSPSSAFQVTAADVFPGLSDDWDPHLSADGLRLYYARGPQPDLEGDIYLAVRSDTSTEFAPGVPVENINHDDLDGAPTLDVSETQLIFASRRPSARSGISLWTATRSHPGAPFSAPTELVELNSSADDDDPSLSGDGRVLYFNSTRTGTNLLYRATRDCL